MLWWGASNEYPQPMFSWGGIRKISVCFGWKKNILSGAVVFIEEENYYITTVNKKKKKKILSKVM